ncbi:MAG TPA: hypothetical protein VK539_13375 [Myxococcaceae bacterium]|nr:hypothetical protein [Myxococcaceae bacterium]
MEKRAKFVLCSLLISLLSITALAGNSLTARIPATIAAGNYAEAEILIIEAVKIGAITSLAAESYRRTIRHAQEGAPGNQQSKKQQPWTPLPDATSPGPSEDRHEKQGRIYVTYTKFNQKTKRFYSGRTSMIINMDKPFRPQAEAAVAARDSNHHVDENDEPKDPAFRGAEIDAFDVGTAVAYENRYGDIAYIRIRGREQQLIDFHGGAQSDTRKTGLPSKTENTNRAVARDHKLGRQFHEAATSKWGLLAKYTGD